MSKPESAERRQQGSGGRTKAEQPSDSTYEAVAHEYYDSALHPTSAALGIASQAIFSQLAQRVKLPDDSTLLEIGPGRQPVSSWFTSAHLIFLDSSEGMLKQTPHRDALTLVVADAEAMPIPTNTVDLILGSLGDPYNTDRFWQEVHRVLRPGGLCLITTPTIEWSSQYRKLEGSPKNRARFTTEGGQIVDLPSYILSLEDQRQLIERNQMQLVDHTSITAHEVSTSSAPKLQVVSEDAPIAIGFLATTTTAEQSTQK